MTSKHTLVYGGLEVTGANQNDTFPYKQITIEEVRQRVENLHNYKWRLVSEHYHIANMPGLSKIDLVFNPLRKPTLIMHESSDYDKYNNISDYFNEPARMRAKRYDAADTPYTHWVKNEAAIRQGATKMFGNDSHHSMREYIYSLYLEATSFRPTLLAGAIKHFGSKYVLDISAGWGDRLIAACALDVVYCGVDPNPLTQDGYAQIIKVLGNSKKQQVIKGKFEDVLLPNRRYDLIFSSPPYFDLEIYNEDDPNQSVNQFKTLDSWVDNFLMVSLKKAWSFLAVGGRMCIIINNIKNKPDYVMKMVAAINKNHGDSLYEGVLSYSEGKSSPQPMWIWTKIGPWEINPPLIMRSYEVNANININSKNINKNINKNIHTTVQVVHEDYMFGGAKQRIIADLMQSLPPNVIELVYAGPETGFAQVAIGVAAKKYHITATFFTSTYGDTITPAMARARQFGTQIKLVRGGLNEAENAAKNYVSNDKTKYLLPFGMEDSIKAYASEIQKYKDIFDDKKSLHIWMAAGSGVILRALAAVFPSVTLHALQVGRTIWDDIKPKNAIIYKTNLKFHEPTTKLPPWPSVSTYDAKIYEIFLKKYDPNATNIIWNVGNDEYYQPSQLNINREYTRWKYVQEMLNFDNNLNNKLKYEASNILERLLLTCANEPRSNIINDPVFCSVGKEITTQFLYECTEKKIPNGPKWLEFIINKMNNFINYTPWIFPSYESQTIYINSGTDIPKILDNTLIYSDYKRTLSQSRIKLLLSLADVDHIVCTSLRYSSIISGSQHWNMPLVNYIVYVRSYGVTFEGFGSPFNTQIMQITRDDMIDSAKYAFGSLFIDCDSIFGSRGSFFAQDFNNDYNNCIVAVGPPYTVKIFNDIANKLLAACEYKKKHNLAIKFLVTMANWADVSGLIEMGKSPYCSYKEILPKSKHFYENSNDNDVKVIARFETILFVLETGMIPADYKTLLTPMKIIDEKTKD